MEKQRKRKVIVIVALLVIIMGVSVAYAAMSTTLNINGTANVVPATWDIHFENLAPAVTTGDATDTKDGVPVPTISDDTLTISDFDVTLTKPGDSVVYTFDIVNNGTLDAKLSTLTMPLTTALTYVGNNADATQKAADEAIVKSNLEYTLTYAGGTAIVPGTDELAHGATASMVLTISYPLTASTIPLSDVQISGMNIQFVYDQI